MYEYVVAFFAVLIMWWKNRAELAKVRAVLQETESQLEASRKLSRAIDGDRQNIANKHNELVNHSSAVTRFGLSVAHVTTTAVAAARQNADRAAKAAAIAASVQTAAINTINCAEKRAVHAESIAKQHAEAAVAAQAMARASDAKAKELEFAGVALDQVIDRLAAGRKRARPE